jgi:hypothetical protein
MISFYCYSDITHFSTLKGLKLWSKVPKAVNGSGIVLAMADIVEKPV